MCQGAGRLGRLPELQPQGSQVRAPQRQPTPRLRVSGLRLRVHQSAVSLLGQACYTKGSDWCSPDSSGVTQVKGEHGDFGALSSLFYLAHEFHHDPRGAILTNTNCGGLYSSGFLWLHLRSVVFLRPQGRTVTVERPWEPCWGPVGLTGELSYRRSGRIS